jgi:hypothetical protein
LNSLIDTIVKPAVRFVYYKQQRAKVFREGRIRRIQNKLIRQFDPAAKKLIVFLVGGADWNSGIDKISGGIISIVSICEESASLKEVHGAEVIMCTLPGQHLMLKHTQFKNNTDVFRFDQLRKYFTGVNDIIFHVPEFLCGYLIEHLDEVNINWLKAIDKVQINILNQNIKLMPSPSIVQDLKSLAHLVTSTTAHQRYCTQEARNYYGIPVHKFSVWISPEKYTYRKYPEKENIVIVSPDLHPMRDAVLEKLHAIPGLEVITIRNLTYEAYKSVIARAKWAITFGEGLDGYIIEPVFSGAIGFAVYNEEFFTADFKALPTIYDSYETLLEAITTAISTLDNQLPFEAYQKLQYDLCAKYYSHETYAANIKAFYLENYTFR